MADDRLTLKVAVEYMCYPLWLPGEDGGVLNPAPEDLGLPTDLAAELNAWSDDFDAIFPQDDPGSAAFATEAEEQAFWDRGRGLAERTADAVRDRYRVTYSDERVPDVIILSGD